MSSPLRVGVVGCGARMALLSSTSLAELGVSVVACCDTNPARGSQCRQIFGDEISFCTQLEQLFRQPLDAVFVFSPDHLHEQHAVAALQAGLAVYLEKPMATTVEGCDRILTAAKESGARLFVGHNLRHAGLFRKLKELVDSGIIGRVRSIWYRHFISYGGDAFFRDWHADRRNTNSLLVHKACHDLDIIHWLGGAPTACVAACGNLAVYGTLPRLPAGSPGCMRWDEKQWPPAAQRDYNPTIDVEDQAVLALQLANGVIASYSQCHFTPDSLRNCTVIGDAGRLENIGDEPDAPIQVWTQRHDQWRPTGNQAFRAEAQPGGHGGADPEIVRSFFQFLRGELPAEAGHALEARMAVAAADMATRSLRAGGQLMQIPSVPAGLVP
jgi:predicted dehydrogenase